MISTIEKNGITWVNVKSPSKEDINHLKDKFSIHELVAEELPKPTFHPKVDLYNNHLYLILHFSVFNEDKSVNRNLEIDFILGGNFIITSHYEAIKPFENFMEKCRTDSEFQEKIFYKHSGFLLFNILRFLYNFTLKELDIFQERIDSIEEKIFAGKERQMLEKLSLLRRDILEFGRAIMIHEAVLSSLEKSGFIIFGEEFNPYLREINSEYFKIKNLFESHKAATKSLQETNDSLLSAKTNEVMKILTIMAFVTFPLMLLSSIFGMNTKILPIVGVRGDFWIIIGIMAIGTIAMFLFFKRKRWL
jgi:magnesium transporter